MQPCNGMRMIHFTIYQQLPILIGIHLPNAKFDTDRSSGWWTQPTRRISIACFFFATNQWSGDFCNPKSALNQVVSPQKTSIKHSLNPQQTFTRPGAAWSRTEFSLENLEIFGTIKIQCISRFGIDRVSTRQTYFVFNFGPYRKFFFVLFCGAQSWICLTFDKILSKLQLRAFIWYHYALPFWERYALPFWYRFVLPLWEHYAWAE